MLLGISLATFVATLLGGLFALKFRDKLHLILGFSAGAVIAVAFFDLIPEAITLANNSWSVTIITTFTALGFAGYMVLDRYISLHHESNRGSLGAISLAIHSFLDGIAIGFAFQVSHAIGLIVACAVLAHDFSDGINTVNLIIKNQGHKAEAIRWLLIDAVAPVLGVAVTMFFVLPASLLSLLLALFAGFFIYIGASDLLPESHHNHPTFWTTFLTLVGMVVLYAVIQLAAI
jgi:ZIP family zinc transporter